LQISNVCQQFRIPSPAMAIGREIALVKVPFRSMELFGGFHDVLGYTAHSVNQAARFLREARCDFWTALKPVSLCKLSGVNLCTLFDIPKADGAILSQKPRDSIRII
jgi:hypothetical protein